MRRRAPPALTPVSPLLRPSPARLRFSARLLAARAPAPPPRPLRAAAAPGMAGLEAPPQAAAAGPPPNDVYFVLECATLETGKVGKVRRRAAVHARRSGPNPPPRPAAPPLRARTTPSSTATTTRSTCASTSATRRTIDPTSCTRHAASRRGGCSRLLLSSRGRATQALLAILDSPLNKAGRVKVRRTRRSATTAAAVAHATCARAMQGVFVHTQKNVLFKVLPSTRLPRTFKRFCGLMGARTPLFSASRPSLLLSAAALAAQCNCCRS